MICWWQLHHWRLSQSSPWLHHFVRPWWPVGHHEPTGWSRISPLRVWRAAWPSLPSACSNWHSFSGWMSLLLRIVVGWTGRVDISGLGVRAAGMLCYSREETPRQTVLHHPLQWWGWPLKRKWNDFFYNLHQKCLCKKLDKVKNEF